MRCSALFTDLYELTMLQSYVRDGMHGTAAFDLFVRRLRARNYLLACGLDAALSCLEEFRFEQEELAYLSSLPQLAPDFIDWLAGLRFTGDVYAVPEGTPVFANEPLLEIVAPLPEAQLVETALLNRVSFATNVASKAARVVHAAAGRPVAEFGMRRLHGIDAAMQAARAAFIVGVDTTSNVQAGFELGIGVSGTMAHSFVQVHESEAEAFDTFARLYPRTTLLVDTYDTLAAIDKAISLYHRLPDDRRFAWVRLDSGDLMTLSRAVRKKLDEGGLGDVRIIASNSLDEFRIHELVAGGAPIDAFGVGTRMGTVSDVPYIDSVYKLVEYDGSPRMKLSTDKSTYPGRKQVYRYYESGKAVRDVLAGADESLDGEPLLVQVMRNGKRTAAGRATMEDGRSRARESMERLPDYLHAREESEPYPVEISERLRKQADELAARLLPT